MAAGERIQIKSEQIAHVLFDNMLVVPVYQRSYAWEENHVLDLLRDLADAITHKHPEYFLGTIVVAESDDSRLEVVDGQQRLATVSILLAAIRDHFYEQYSLHGVQDDIARCHHIESTYLTKTAFRTQEQLPRLRLNETDNDFYSRRVLLRPDHENRRVAPSKGSHQLIEQAATLAARHVASIVAAYDNPTDTLSDWIEYLHNNARVIWVKVPDHSDAYTIFETLNDRGLTLAISDLLKNYLFHQAGETRLAEVQQRWTSMCGALEAFGNEEAMVDYIRHLWSSLHGATREKQLYDAIRADVRSSQSAVDFSSGLADGARLYAALLNPEHEHWSQYGPHVPIDVDTIGLLRMAQIRPLLLAVLAEFEHREVEKCLSLMVSWGVRFLICGGMGSGTLEAQYSDRAVRVRGGRIASASQLADAMKELVPTDDQFYTAYSTATVSRNHLARYYLRTLEMEARSTPEPELVPNPDQATITLEHVLPRSPSANWPSVTDEIHKANCRRLGNLVLVKASVNSCLGDASFTSKVQYFRESDFALTRELAEYSQWGPSQIQERQNRLADLAVRAWPVH